MIFSFVFFVCVGYDPNSQFFDANTFDPNFFDPNAQFDPNAGFYDPNQQFDPNAQYAGGDGFGYGAGGMDPNWNAGMDPNMSMDPNNFGDGSGNFQNFNQQWS